ncbi:MAG: protease inhibitor I42 family protein [Candidatus Omnitrophica bacterium]|nr:protease inhibitor I42 family protein [Candidatus Omnitrophota bacterium]MBU1870269.1 protease inhibitor I42 family protein [Candidatus Omnitrophota bacterium]
MNKKLTVALILVLVCAVGAFCLTGRERDFSDPNKPVKIKLGQEFSLILDSNATTGYQWQFAEPIFDKNIAEFVRSEYIIPKTKLVGAGGKEIWVFKALKAGKTTISFKYVRPWEKDVLPVKTASFVIVVTP